MEVPTLPTPVVDALADARRRLALSVLADRGRAVSVDALAADVSRRGPSATATATDPGPAHDSLRSSLYHVHLPVLEATGAVTFDPRAGLVGPVTDSPFDRPWVERLRADHPDPSYDRVLAALASERRQAALVVLLADGRTSEADLARHVAAGERGCDPGAVPDAVRQVVDISLSHTHLPELVEAGFVARDLDARTVRPEPMPWRSDPWVAASPIAEWAAAE